MDSDDATQPAAPGRYFFGLLDNRSSYGNDFFPDLFIGPEFDKETQLEVDYFHSEKRDLQDDEVDGEFEWNVAGELTVAAEFGWESSHFDDDDPSGFENVDLAAYHPIFQYVSADGFFDYTSVLRLDVGIPTRTPQSGSDVQLTPYWGQLIRLGDHVEIQQWIGGQFTIAANQVNPFIYGASFGYELTHEQVSMPLTDSVIPMLELDGTTPFSSRGQDALFGVAGFEWNLASGSDVEPAVSVGYQFPLDAGAREQLDWGIIFQVFVGF